MKKVYLIIALFLLVLPTYAQKWSVEKANQWYKQQGWLVGANYTPAYAINQLEFWQAETFNLQAIDKEFGYAENIGMNSMRVFLHHTLWKQDRAGFKKRIDQFLTVADKHGIKISFVFFDDCWNDTYSPGVQPVPVLGKHNSGWLRDPGTVIANNKVLMDVLEAYVKDILQTFNADKRILMWDLYNEPGNNDQGNNSLLVLRNVFKWAREVNPTQPITVGLWTDRYKELNEVQIENSDIISYHSYAKPEEHLAKIQSLRIYKRPLICTEYMARKHGSTFAAILPLLKKENIGAINWGLVDGKTNTKYAWDELISDGAEPKLWFHEVFRNDGTPYDVKETQLIRTLTKVPMSILH
jgi:hypothetical protein